MSSEHILFTTDFQTIQHTYKQAKERNNSKEDDDMTMLIKKFKIQYKLHFVHVLCVISILIKIFYKSITISSVFSSSNKSKSLQNTNITRFKESLHIICKQALSVARF